MPQVPNVAPLLDQMTDIRCVPIIEGQSCSLLAPMTHSLILNILKSLKRNKAPGPDGFTVEFYLASWDIVGSDFCDAIMHFFVISIMHYGIKSTSIAMFLKCSPLTHERVLPYFSLHNCLQMHL